MVFTALVRNTGVTPTPPLPTGVAFSVDGTVVSWSGSDSTPLGPGDQRTFTADDGVTGAAWTATDGEHAVEATVDDTGQIPELNEDDNTTTTQIVVPDKGRAAADQQAPVRLGGRGGLGGRVRAGDERRPRERTPLSEERRLVLAPRARRGGRSRRRAGRAART